MRRGIAPATLNGFVLSTTQGPAVVLVLLLLALPACTASRVRMSPAEAHAALGRVGVVSVGWPSPEFGRPLTSRGRAATSGALAGALAVPAHAGPESMIFFLAFAPISAAIGALYGAIAAESPEEVERGVHDLETAVAELRIPETLRDLVVVELERQAYADVSIHHDPASTDTLVEIRVPSVALQGQGVNPTLRLYVPATIRVVRADVEVRTSSLSTVGEGHKFRRWARDDAREFRQQVGVELERLAKKIVDDLLSRPHE